MKKIVMILFLCAAAFGVNAQNKESIQKLTIVEHDISFYSTQSVLWKEDVQMNPSNEESWYNYFLASRYSFLLGKKPFEQTQKQMLQLLDEMGKAIPNSFTYNLTMGWQLGAWDKNSLTYFERARLIKPNDPQVLYEIIFPYEVFGTKEQKKEVLNKYYDTQTDSPQLLNFAYNLLSSVEQNGIVFTIGDNDTYSLWIAQDVLGFRTDVQVININFLGISEYRSKLLHNAGIDLNEKDKNYLIKMGGEDDGATEEIRSNLIELLSKYTSRPIHIANTIGEEFALRKNINDKLYLTGLTCLYSKNKIDNIAIIKKHFEQDFLLDYILLDFRKDEKAEMIKLCNGAYLGSFIYLYKHYFLAGEREKAKKLKVYIDKIAIGIHRENEVENWLK